MALIMAVLMVFVSVPLDSIDVKASLAADEFSMDGSKITGYTGDTTKTRLVIGKDVTGIASGVFTSTTFTALKEVVILNDEINIEEGAFDSSLITREGFKVWCNSGSNAETYMKTYGGSEHIGYLNVKELKMYSQGNTVIAKQDFWSDCEPFQLCVTINAKDAKSACEDIIWSSTNSDVLWLQDNNGNKVEETAGTITKVAGTEGVYVSTVNVYVCKTDYFTGKDFVNTKASINVNSRSLVDKAEAEFTIHKATKNIKAVVINYKPRTYYDEEKKKEYICVDESGRMIVDEVVLDENYPYFKDNTIYIDKGYCTAVGCIIDENCDDYILLSQSFKNVEYLTSHKFNATIVGTEENNSEVTLTGMVDGDGNEIQGELLYANAKVSGEPFSLTSSNSVLKNDYKINISVPAKDFSMKVGATSVDNGGGIVKLNQSSTLLSCTLDPNESTDTVTWSSADEAVAQITEGNILKLNTTGSTLITCTVNKANGGPRDLRKSFVVYSVKKVPYNQIVFLDQNDKTKIVNSINIATSSSTANKERYEISLGDAKDGVLYTPPEGEQAANEPVSYAIADESIVKMEEFDSETGKGKLVPQSKTGTTTVTIISESGKEASLTVNVYSKVENISAPSSATVPAGQTRAFGYLVVPTDANEDIVWKSADESIAVAEDYVDDLGNRFVKITGKKVGSVMLTGTSSVSRINATINAIVAKPVNTDTFAVDAINGEQTTDENGNIVYNVEKGKKFTLNIDMKNNSGATPNDLASWVVNDGVEAKDFTCEVSEKSINITGKAVGKVKVDYVAMGINGETGEKVEKHYTFYVNIYVPATDIKINVTTAGNGILSLANTTELSATLTPGDSTDEIKWTVDGDCVSLSKDTTKNGEKLIMTAKKVGKANITAKASSGIYAVFTINIVIPATDIKFVQYGAETSRVYVAADAESTVSLKVIGDDTTDKNFTWSTTSDYARVTPNEDGTSAVVKGIAPGTTNITVTADSGVTRTIPVTIVVPSTDLKLNNTEFTIDKGDAPISIFATLAPSNTTDVVRWTVDKEGIVNIAENTSSSTASAKYINVTGVEAGEVNITATTVSGLTATVKVIVKSKDITKITTSEIADMTYTGAALTPICTVMFGDAQLRQNYDYKFEYSNNVNVGTATITITGMGNYAGTKTVNFNIVAKDINTVQNSAITPLVYNGSAQTQDIKLTSNATGAAVDLVEGTDYTLKFEDNQNVGNAKAIFTGKGNYTGEKTVIFAITAKNFTSDDIKIQSITDKTYTGEAIMPDVVVKDGSTKLVKDTDYTVAYANNIQAGTATVTVTGRGNYTGTKSTEFKIGTATLSGIKFTDIANQIYTGQALTPGFTATIGTRNLAINTDYTVTYKNNKKPGKATIKLTGTGNYTGTASKTFIILPVAPTNPSMSKSTASSVTLKWTKSYGATGYVIYAYNASKNTYKKIGTSTKNTYTAKKLKAGTTNSYQIYAYVKVGSKTYQSTSAVTVSAGTKPGKTAIKSITSVNGTAMLTWKAVTGAEGYEVYTSASKKGKYKLASTVSNVQASVTGLKIKKTAYFKVRAYRTVNGVKIYGAYSAIKSKKIK